MCRSPSAPTGDSQDRDGQRPKSRLPSDGQGEQAPVPDVGLRVHGNVKEHFPLLRDTHGKDEELATVFAGGPGPGRGTPGTRWDPSTCFPGPGRATVLWPLCVTADHTCHRRPHMRSSCACVLGGMCAFSFPEGPRLPRAGFTLGKGLPAPLQGCGSWEVTGTDTERPECPGPPRCPITGEGDPRPLHCLDDSSAGADSLLISALLLKKGQTTGDQRADRQDSGGDTRLTAVGARGT